MAHVLSNLGRSLTLAGRHHEAIEVLDRVRAGDVELAQSQTFRRRTVALDPMLTVLLPDRRFEIAPDLALFEREMDREFPEVRREDAAVLNPSDVGPPRLTGKDGELTACRTSGRPRRWRRRRRRRSRRSCRSS